ncbi:pentapeptide repeat-containing protein [Roseobacter sp. HKCCA0434]|uniref:pentapeptide repeat-containing protein n=1 Tax=Roseobacter sp. HKCCA0434 TaxID=3079297 RepID=UPI0029059402|nr:pentapeptide repeat-containing protein [Roseobacter sp. HKCCA0434]
MTFREWIGLKAYPRYEDARWLGPILLVLVVLIGAALLIAVLLRTFDALLSGTGDLRSYLYFLIALIGLPFVIWRAVVAQKQATTAEQGLLTDRFTKAVEQLGAERTIKTVVDGKEVEKTEPNLEVRLGGIYALERISQDSLRDHITVMEVLCAYLRENAKKPDTFMKDEDGNDVLLPPRVDIQAALTVIGRRPRDRIAYEMKLSGDKASYILDLRECWLARADLRRSELGNVRLENSILIQADLREACLINSKLGDADFTSALLLGADLQKSNMFSTNFTSAHLDRANLTEARLLQTKFYNANLYSAKLVRANLFKADLTAAKLNRTNFSKSDMNFCIIFLSAMRHTQLNSAKNLSIEKIETAFGDDTTILPDDMPIPAHWQSYKTHQAFYVAWHAALEEAGLR